MPVTRRQAQAKLSLVVRLKYPGKRSAAEAGLPTSGKAVRKVQKVSPQKPKVNTAFEENQAKPKPCGNPAVWAAERQPLCETQYRYFKSYQNSTYYKDGTVFGLLLDKDRSEGGYMDDQIIICRVGGCFSMNEDGTSVQVRDQNRASANVACFESSLLKKTPVVVIVGSNMTYSPVAMPHRYNVLDFFYITHFWAENRNGKVLYRIRLEKRDLLAPSWWAPEGAQVQRKPKDLKLKAKHQACHSCHQDSPQVYQEAWYCLNADCNKKGLLTNGSKLISYVYDDAFLKSRTFQDLSVKPQWTLVPPLPEPDPLNQSQASGRDAWRGICCPKCGRCNSREDWNGWKCGTEGCDFNLPCKHLVLSYKDCLSGPEYDGHALDLDSCDTSVVNDLKTHVHGDYHVHKWEILPSNFVTHIMANKHTNAGVNGPNDMFNTLQAVDLHLKRLRMPSRMLETPKLTKHFAHNYGREYKYIAEAMSTPFKDAPKIILEAIGRLDWAARVASGNSNFKGHNEVLVVGYFAEQGMGYHDDGEKGIGKIVVSLSLGGDAIMTWRLKKKYYLPEHMKMKNIDTYDPSKPVRKGSKFFKQREALNILHGIISVQAFNAEKLKLYTAYKKSISVNCSPVITMNLKHGDYMIMDGDLIQKYYEHQVVATGNKLRFALTARTIDADVHGIDADDSNYQRDPEDIYNGQ